MRQLKPPENLSVSEWADKYRMLDSKTSAMPGPWRNDKTPYLKDIMDELRNYETEEIVFCKCTQVGGTELLDAYQKREEELQKALQQVAQYPKWRQQSIEIQEKINNQLSELSKHQVQTSQKIDKMEEDRKAGELNKLQAQLLSSYHYYTNEYKNPQLAWSKMESKSFWDSFGDYEKLGGNGFMHSEVQPAMNRLEEIEMDDTDRLVELYASRRS